MTADLCNIEETNEGSCISTRLAFSLQLNLGYEYETNVFIIAYSQHKSLTFNYDLDL